MGRQFPLWFLLNSYLFSSLLFWKSHQANQNREGPGFLVSWGRTYCPTSKDPLQVCHDVITLNPIKENESKASNAYFGAGAAVGEFVIGAKAHQGTNVPQRGHNQRIAGVAYLTARVLLLRHSKKDVGGVTNQIIDPLYRRSNHVARFQPVGVQARQHVRGAGGNIDAIISSTL